LNTERWEFKVRHPKGEGTYGRQRVVPIPDRLRPVVVQYLKERDAMLAGKGRMDVAPLLPSCRDPDHSISTTTVDKWVAEIVRETGISFGPHALRRTYGQMLLDQGVGVEAVSLMLGHSSTTTTEKHYCRKTDDSARLEVVQAMRSLNVNPVRLTSESELPGYA
jgi:integrase